MITTESSFPFRGKVRMGVGSHGDTTWLDTRSTVTHSLFENTCARVLRNNLPAFIPTPIPVPLRLLRKLFPLKGKELLRINFHPFTST